MKPPKITAGPIPAKSDRPVSKNIPAKQRWTFSFRFWHQPENFGLGACQRNWFVSLIERLSELSSTSLEDIINSQSNAAGIRYHEIDWGSKNIPIQRSDLDWLAPDYRDNSEEFPIVQFHISKALGRVIGFFDENSVFNVVLLDPNHNMQPSNYNDYEIRPTTAGKSDIYQLVSRVERHANSCRVVGCAIRDSLIEAVKLDSPIEGQSIIVASISAATYARLIEISKTDACNNFSEVFEHAISAFEDLAAEA